MKTRLLFQTVKPGTTQTEAVTLSDAAIEIDGACCVPAVGDIVSQQVCWPQADRGNVRSFKVVARHFVYMKERVLGDDLGNLVNCDVYVVVTAADENELGVSLDE